MGDLIEREKLLDSLPKNDTVLSLDVRKIVLDAPAVAVVPLEYHDKCMEAEIEKRIRTEKTNRKRTGHGRWKDTKQNIYGAISGQCSICGLYSHSWSRNNPYKYCPNCGAKMDREEEPW